MGRIGDITDIIFNKEIGEFNSVETVATQKFIKQRWPRLKKQLLTNDKDLYWDIIFYIPGFASDEYQKIMFDIMGRDYRRCDATVIDNEFPRYPED